MGKPWSDERHMKLAIKRMKEIQSGKAKVCFLMGPVAKFRVKGTDYNLSLNDDRAELSAYRKNRKLFEQKLKGAKFQSFISDITDWLRFPHGYVVYKKMRKTLVKK